MKNLWLAALLALPLFAGPARADEDGDDEAMAVADRYGMQDLERLDALKFTYNLRVGTTTTTRGWTWDGATGEVTLTQKSGRKTVTKTCRLPAGDAEVTALYRNDRAWLFFPFHIANDRGIEVIFDEGEALPLPPGRAGRLTVEYAEGSDDIPARVFELYVDADHTIRQWTLRPDWKASNSVSYTWEDNQKLGPVTVSLRRRAANGDEVFFSDVEARVRGSTGWIKVAPAEK